MFGNRTWDERHFCDEYSCLVMTSKQAGCCHGFKALTPRYVECSALKMMECREEDDHIWRSVVLMIRFLVPE